MAESAARGTMTDGGQPGAGVAGSGSAGAGAGGSRAGRFSMIPVDQPSLTDVGAGGTSGVNTITNGRSSTSQEEEEKVRLLLQQEKAAGSSPDGVDEPGASFRGGISIQPAANGGTPGGEPTSVTGTGGEDVENGNLARNDHALASVSVIDTAHGSTNGGGGGGGGSSYKPIKNRRKSFPRNLYERLLKVFDVSKKSERPFLLLIVICLLLLLIIVVLAVCWPHIPDYLRLEVCVESECLEASKQIMTWAKPSVATCQTPYEWACGRFEERFRAHAFREISRGEWSPRAHETYQRATEEYEFITKLPTAAMSYSTQLMIHKLHTGCTRLETVGNREASNSLRRVLLNLGGWRMIDMDRQYWDLRENLQLVQPKYGAAPFFKLGVDTRNQPPYDYMITVGEGDLGLPSKEFYALSEKHPIIRAYHAFLMDTLAHMISTSTENAQDYAKKIYNYEKRIALDVLGAVSRTDLGNFTQPQIRTMHQLVNDAPSLPILEAAQAMFKSKKITEHTEVMVSSPAALKAISQIITTSDKEVLNNYFMWSVIRHFVPFMSREFRVSLHQFEQTLYGAGAAMPSMSPLSSSSSSSSEAREPMWHFCTNVVRQWMPYGLEALRENPALIVHDQRDANDYHHHHHQHQQHSGVGGGGGGAGGALLVSQHELAMQQSRLLQQQTQQQQHHQSLLQQQQQQHHQHHNQEEPQHHRAEYGIGGSGEELLMAGIATVGIGGYSQHHYQLNERLSYDDELVKVIFYHLRDEFGRALLEARWLSGDSDERLRRYVADKLASVRLQVGIPRELLRNERTLNEYYGQLVLDGLLFVDSVVNQWDFTKSQMTRMLDNQTEVERILTEMFPPRSAAEQLQRERQAGRNHEHYRTPQPNPLVKYSIALNMVLISRQRLRQPYFSHHYPISVNFARLGADIAFSLQSAIHTLIEQYRNVELASGAHQQQLRQNVLDEEAQNCMPRSLIQGFFATAGSGRLMNETRLNLYLGLSAVTVLTRAFGTLLGKIERNERIYEADILEQTTYEMLGLSRQPSLRLPGLQPYDEQQLFTLAYLQRHCTADYSRHRLTKLLIEHDIPEFDKFEFLWHRVASFGGAFGCSAKVTAAAMTDGDRRHCHGIL